VNLRLVHRLAVCGFLTVAMFATAHVNAQYLTLEGQTGGFLTPTAYVVYMEKGQAFSHPAIGFHFIDASKVIGNIETFSITEAFYGRAEAGYTRSVHQFGDSGSGSPSATVIPGGFSALWNANGMNIFHGKVVAINDGQFGPWTPGVAVGGLVRTGDKFSPAKRPSSQRKPTMRTVITPERTWKDCVTQRFPSRLPSRIPMETSTLP